MTHPSSQRYVAASCLCLALVGFGGSILLVALPAIAAEFHAGLAELAHLGAVLALGAGLAVPLSALTDRWRRGPMVALAMIGFSVAALASAAATDVRSIALARLVAVCFETLVAAVATASAVESVAAMRRGRTTSLLALASGAGAALAVGAFPVVAPHWRALYIIAGITGLALAPLGLAVAPRGHVHDGSTASVLLREPWRGRIILLAGSAALGGALFEPANFFSLVFGSVTLHLGALTLSLLLGVSGAAAAAGFVIGGALSDRFGRRLPATILALAAPPLAALSFAPVAWAYLAAGVAWSLVAGLVTPILGAWTAELVPARGRVTAYAIVGLAGVAGGVAGLEGVARVIGRTGLPAAMWVAAVPAAAGALLLIALPETGRDELAA